MQRYLHITAPFDGVITARNSSVGALAGTGAGEPLFSLSKENPLRLTVSLPEKHAASVTPGMRAAFSVRSQPGKVFEAVLSRTSGLLDRQDRSLTLEFDVDNSSGELQGGDYARVTLTLQRNRPSHWVPGKSVLNTQSGTYVMTLNGDEIRRIPVQEGIRLDTLTEVFGDLSAADNVLVKPSEEIKTGKIN
ncbi:efflux RND transporter periplasmic adaptor subunit [Parapedobacter sp. GCM10030251]|uniref:efflux RND transporter periplasmic adaptor subunit n=1 Tax=Parapedobacter sp. GCM10030251 TaxID=3273419 RepID=UPI00361ECD77